MHSNRFIWVAIVIAAIIFILLPLGFYLVTRFPIQQLDTMDLGLPPNYQPPHYVVPPVAESGSVYLQVISPNGGENLCIGEGYPIQWRSNALRTVEVLLRVPGRSAYPLGIFPAKYGGVSNSDISIYQWTVGHTETGLTSVPDGITYEIFIRHDGGGDVSDGLFTIRACG